jgi:hypothetical protein
MPAHRPAYPPGRTAGVIVSCAAFMTPTRPMPPLPALDVPPTRLPPLQAVPRGVSLARVTVPLSGIHLRAGALARVGVGIPVWLPGGRARGRGGPAATGTVAATRRGGVLGPRAQARPAGPARGHAANGPTGVISSGPCTANSAARLCEGPRRSAPPQVQVHRGRRRTCWVRRTDTGGRKRTAADA